MNRQHDISMEDLSEFCAPGASAREEMVPVTDQVTLRVVHFTPARDAGNPAVVFVAGWISLMVGWQEVLLEMTRDFPVIYVETREKISSCIRGRVTYDVKSLGDDLIEIVKRYGLKAGEYVMFGSSLGATVILDCCRQLREAPLGMILIVPNAVFRVPRSIKFIILFYYPDFYFIMKRFVKWYLKHFRMDVKSDPEQFRKYCRSLDAADPWKLKRAALAFSRYQVWPILESIHVPVLIVAASKDRLHEPEYLKKMASVLPRAQYLDMETNKKTHTRHVVERMREYIAGLRGQPKASR